MGAQSFFTKAKGASAKEAFQAARDEAAYEYGHRGYTGTIAEKNEFVLIEAPSGNDPEEFAQKIVYEGDERIDNKWGPAGCIALGQNEFLFFGNASS